MFSIGVDLGGTNIAAGVVDKSGKIVQLASIPTQRERNYAEIIRDLVELIQHVINKSSIHWSDIQKIGVGLPGVVDKKNKEVIYSCNLPFRYAPVGRDLKQFFDKPIYLENDANCAAIAEHNCGSTQGVYHFVLVTIGTGIGGGIFIDGRIYSGFNAAASEIGHMVIHSMGEKCSCGREGCFEAYSSATALIRQAKKALESQNDSILGQRVRSKENPLDAKMIFEAASEGDGLAQKILRDFIYHLSVGIVNLINIFQPEVVVIGGGVSKAGEDLLEPLRKQVYGSIYSGDFIPKPKLTVASAGNDAGIIGAALLEK
jgi:glucokinase